MDAQIQYSIPSTWYHVLGTKYFVPSSWYQVLGYQVLGTTYLVSSTWYQVLGTKYLVPSSVNRSQDACGTHLARGTAKLGGFPAGFRGIGRLALTSPPCPSKPPGYKQEEAHLRNTTRPLGNFPVYRETSQLTGKPPRSPPLGPIGP